ncbi:aspartate carbamoyltransferase regulatory subunit [Candidatus Avoscillospira sp. LCP25S3_F1]|uniref:aspartate carbamoyltransferase regulatory subunit n=1 Tax=Candidatus Avoscillospira sp. LCP25S3_F1 TaxID=3438825 RepID=UPI003F9220AF
MNIDSIRNGYVLDHIKAGRSMEIYKYLKLNELDCSVAIIKNVKSSKMGKKDIIKIDSLIDLDLTVLGYIDPGITVNVIQDGKLLEKKPLELPTKLVNVIHCKNPRCITSTEPHLEALFLLTHKADGNRSYRCAYCDTEFKR